MDSDTEKQGKQFIALERGSFIGHNAKSSYCECATACEFLTLDRELYIKEGIYENESKEFEERFNFFRNWSLLENWSDNAVYDIANVSFTNNYSRGTLVMRDREETKKNLLWFVLSGEVDVFKVIGSEFPSTLMNTQKKFTLNLDRHNVFGTNERKAMTNCPSVIPLNNEKDTISKLSINMIDAKNLKKKVF